MSKWLNRLYFIRVKYPYFSLFLLFPHTLYTRYKHKDVKKTPSCCQDDAYFTKCLSLPCDKDHNLIHLCYNIFNQEHNYFAHDRTLLYFNDVVTFFCLSQNVNTKFNIFIKNNNLIFKFIFMYDKIYSY